MRGISPVALLIAVFLVQAALVRAAQPDAVPLHPGDTFPEVSGMTLTNRPFDLPNATAGKPLLVIFSFSKAAGKDARMWNEHFSTDFSDAVPTYMVIVLESVPKLLRGMVTSSIKGTMPLSAQDRAMVLYHDEGLWKRRLEVSSDGRAFVLLLDPDKRIGWINSAMFTPSEYAQLD